MGYIITKWDVRFVNAQAMLEYYKDKEIVLKHAIYDCPTAERNDIFQTDIKGDQIAIKPKMDRTWEFKEKLIWIPYFAEFVEGYFTVTNEDDAKDMWAVHFNGTGRWQLMKGEIVYKEIELK